MVSPGKVQVIVKHLPHWNSISPFGKQRSLDISTAHSHLARPLTDLHVATLDGRITGLWLPRQDAQGTRGVCVPKPRELDLGGMTARIASLQQQNGCLGSNSSQWGLSAPRQQQRMNEQGGGKGVLLNRCPSWRYWVGMKWSKRTCWSSCRLEEWVNDFFWDLSVDKGSRHSLWPCRKHLLCVCLTPVEFLRTKFNYALSYLQKWDLKMWWLMPQWQHLCQQVVSKPIIKMHVFLKSYFSLSFLCFLYKLNLMMWKLVWTHSRGCCCPLSVCYRLTFPALPVRDHIPSLHRWLL